MGKQKYNFFEAMMRESKTLLNEIDGKVEDVPPVEDELEGDIDFSEPGTEEGLEGEEKELTPEVILAKLQELADEYGTDIEAVEAMAMEALSKSEEEEGEEESAEELGDLATEEGAEEEVEGDIPDEAIPESKVSKKPVVDKKVKPVVKSNKKVEKK